MRTHQPPRSFTAMNWVQTIAIVVLSVVLFIAMWPFVWISLFGTKAPALTLPTFPTAAIQVRPAQPVLSAPVSLPTPFPAEFAPADVPLQSVIADDPDEGRHAEIAAPPPAIPQEGGGGQGVFAPQETHECRHGQVWVDEKGCKNAVTP